MTPSIPITPAQRSRSGAGDEDLESDVGRWLPWDQSRHGLRAQLRVNNVFGDRFPKYINEPSGAGVQPYGDWRGRVYSLSLTASF